MPSYWTQQTGDTLRASFSVSLGWPLGLSLVVLPIFWFPFAWHTVDCVRKPDGRVAASVRSHRLGWATKPHVIDDLRSARIESRRGGRSGRRPDASALPVHRVMLVDASGLEHPVSVGSSSGRGKYETLANGVNRFLANTSARRASVRQPLDLVALLLLIFPLAGIVLYVVCRAECVIDRSMGTVQVVQWGILGPRTTTLPLSDVREFALQQVPSRWARRPPTYAALFRTDGSVLRLAQSSSSEDDGPVSSVLADLERFRAGGPGHV